MRASFGSGVERSPRLSGVMRIVVMLLSITAASVVLNGCSSDDGGCDYAYPIHDEPLCIDIALAFDCQEVFQDLDECLLENCICDVDMDCGYTFDVETMEECQDLADQLLCGPPTFAAGVCTLSMCQICLEDSAVAQRVASSPAGGIPAM